jgi:4,5-DOPA dioxygenase extradiol
MKTITAVSPAPTFHAANAIPPIFISHGSPLMMLDAGAAGAAWQRLAAQAPRPRAILAVSAHWLTRVPAVSAAPQPETIHDFHGFPAALYDIEYRPPGALDLVEEIRALIPGIGIDPQRGLDHGAWIPLRAMYPAADIPVIQLGIMPAASPEEHFRLGQQLAPLTRQGVLLLASGGLTHNLRDLQPAMPDGEALSYVVEFSDWFNARLAANDLPALFDYRRQAPHAVRAHPSEEHLLPIFVAMGAAGMLTPPTTAYRDYSNGALALDAFVFTPAAAAAADRAEPSSHE